MTESLTVSDVPDDQGTGDPMSEVGPTTEPPLVPGWREWWALLTHRPAAAALGGMVAGFVIGGIGGRLAMLLLRLTSDEAVRGLESDDGFTIGQISFDTIGLLILTTVAGGGAALGYLLVRRWLPQRLRPLQIAVFLGVVGGTAVIEPGGVDFTFLEPLWLAVVLFVALPAVYGAAMVWGVEWLIAHPDDHRRLRIAALLPMLGFVMAGPGLIVAVISSAAVVAARRRPDLVATAGGAIPTWTVRLGLLALLALAGDALAGDVTEVL